MLYIFSNYAATGEGQTISMLITKAFPHAGDFNPDGSVKFSREELALREFKSIFGDFFSSGGKIVEEHEFFQEVGEFIPDPVKKLLQQKVIGNFKWFSQIHVNFW